MNPKKIAVCISGQLRNGLLAYKNLRNFFGETWQDCDFFIHTWDRNTFRNVLNLWMNERPHQIVEEHSLKTYQDLYQPKKFLIENQQHIYYDGVIKKYGPTSTLANLYYSFSRSIELKNQYEKENNISYDIVVRIRPDIIFHPSRRLINDIKEYKAYPTDLFSLRSDDIYWIGNSDTMNRAAKFFYEPGQVQGSIEWLIGKFTRWLNDANIDMIPLRDHRFTVIRPEAVYFCPIEHYDIINLINIMLYEDIMYVSRGEMWKHYVNDRSDNWVNDMYQSIGKLTGPEVLEELKLQMPKNLPISDYAVYDKKIQ